MEISTLFKSTEAFFECPLCGGLLLMAVDRLGEVTTSCDCPPAEQCGFFGELPFQ